MTMPSNMLQTNSVMNVAATMPQQNFSFSLLCLAAVSAWLSQASQCVWPGRKTLAIVCAKVGCSEEEFAGLADEEEGALLLL